jgi:hypothetical protein
MGCKGQGGDQVRLGVRQRVSRGRGCESRLLSRMFCGCRLSLVCGRYKVRVGFVVVVSFDPFSSVC